MAWTAAAREKAKLARRKSATISLSSVKTALKAAKNASTHTKRIRAANPDYKLPRSLSRFVAYSD